ncbi:MAG: hypothetical protein DWP98_11975 [Bacteroidetes bacterium]|nr:MAG: hypothetical protein DWP98_11975 [Bacteroidota bacterium]
MLFIVGVSSVLLEEMNLVFSLSSGLVYFFAGLYYWFVPYLKVIDGVLWVNTYPFRKVNLKDVVRIKHFLDEVIIVCNGKETRISNYQMSKEDQVRFNNFVNELNKKTSENQFYKK